MLPATRIALLPICLTLACDAAPTGPADEPAPTAPHVASAPAAGIPPLAAMALLAFGPAPQPVPLPRRFIAVYKDPLPPDATGAHCPQINPWKQALVFDANLPAYLRRFCVYQTDSANLAALTVAQFPQGKKPSRVDPDPLALLPQDDHGFRRPPPAILAENTAVLKEQRGNFFQSLAAMDADRAAASPYANDLSLLRMPKVVVVDTMTKARADQVTAYPADASWQRHGIAMAQFINDVRCPDDSDPCRRLTSYAPAFLPDLAGSYGSAGTLAAAIGRVLENWHTLPKLSRPPLVLNLSVGWDVTHGDLATPQHNDYTHYYDRYADIHGRSPANAQAVFAALTYASCLDVLTIAASGNNLGGPCEQQGALAPARWERLPAPTQEQCATLFGAEFAPPPGTPKIPSPPSPGPSKTPTKSSRPLVYAAGGIQSNDQPLPNARVNSRPARVLPAMLAVAGQGALLTEAWSGTSVAAAALSGLAANLWTYNTQLTSHEIMRAIDVSGSPIATDDGPTRRVSARAAYAALPGPKSPNNPYRTPLAQTTTAALTQALPSTTTTVEYTDMLYSMQQIQCGGQTRLVHRNTIPGAPPIPPVVKPWLRPQPDSPICPICPIKGGKLTLSLNPKSGVQQANLTTLTLDLLGTDGTILSVTLPPVEMNGDTTLSLTQQVKIGVVTEVLGTYLQRPENPYRSGTLSFYDTASSSRRLSDITVSP